MKSTSLTDRVDLWVKTLKNFVAICQTWSTKKSMRQSESLPTPMDRLEPSTSRKGSRFWKSPRNLHQIYLLRWKNTSFHLKATRATRPSWRRWTTIRLPTTSLRKRYQSFCKSMKVDSQKIMKISRREETGSIWDKFGSSRALFNITCASTCSTK